MATIPQSHTARVPASIIESMGGDGQLVVRFDWTPGLPDEGGDALSIEEVSFDVGGMALLTPEEEETVAEWLDANWGRPDSEARNPEPIAEAAT